MSNANPEIGVFQLVDYKSTRTICNSSSQSAEAEDELIDDGVARVVESVEVETLHNDC